VMAELELREEALFANMSQEEIQQAIRFMEHLNTVRRALEAEVTQHAKEAKHIYIEFTGLADEEKT